MKLAVTIDIGTTQVKLCLFDAQGSLLVTDKAPTPTARDGWGAIYDVDALVALVRVFIAGLASDHRKALRVIAIAGVGESGGLVGPDLTLHSPIILWHDQRGAAVLEPLGNDERIAVYETTGLPVNANYALSKVVWAVRAAGTLAPDVKWLNVSEYLAAVMTGRRWAEYSLASRTMALDLTQRQWSPTVCELVGLDVGVFPELRSASEGEQVRSSFAADVGVDRSVTVHVVGHDHMVGGVGAGLESGQLLNSTGTTEGLLELRSEPALDQKSADAKLANGLSCRGADFTLFASIPTGGSAFQTLQSMLGLSAPALSAVEDGLHERYLAGRIDLSAVPIVVPHFRGSPPPEKSSAARGIIANVGSDVTTDEVVFGCFLGLAIQFRKVWELFPDPPPVVKVIGPASRDRLWLQLKADVLGCTLSYSEFGEVVSKGAQALACDQIGQWAECAPKEIDADERRRVRLGEWREGAGPILEQLGGLSW